LIRSSSNNSPISRRERPNWSASRRAAAQGILPSGAASLILALISSEPMLSAGEEIVPENLVFLEEERGLQAFRAEKLL
jgi:hypothetical protein